MWPYVQLRDNAVRQVYTHIWKIGSQTQPYNKSTHTNAGHIHIPCEIPGHKIMFTFVFLFLLFFACVEKGKTKKLNKNGSTFIWWSRPLFPFPNETKVSQTVSVYKPVQR